MSTIVKMQRLLAVLLLGTIGFLPVGSAFGDAVIAANLPACCRALGKHHCAMPSLGLSADGKPGMRSKAKQCPFVPSVSSAPVSASIFPSPDSHLIFQAKENDWVPAARPNTLFQIAFDRNSQKRGPPAFLS